MSFRIGKVRNSVTVPIFKNVEREEADDAAQKRYESGQLPEEVIYKSFYLTDRPEWASANGHPPDPMFYLKLNRLTTKHTKKIAEQLDGGETLVHRSRRGDAQFARRTVSPSKQLEAQETIYDMCIEGWDEVLGGDGKPLECVTENKSYLVEALPGVDDFILAFCRDPRNFGEDKATFEKKDQTSGDTSPS